MKIIAALLIAGSVTTAGFGIDTLIRPISPDRLMGSQCKDVCTFEDACSTNGVPNNTVCNVGTKRSNCCDYFGLQ